MFEIYTDGLINNRSVFAIGDQTGVGVWTSQRDISATSNITTNGTITSAGLIQGFALTVTGSSPVSAFTPTVAGFHLNNCGGYAHIDLAGSSTSTGGYIDFTVAGTDSQGRMVYRHASSQFEWNIADRGTPKMTLKSSGLYIGATLVSASDKRLKFKEKPLVNALDII